jgi:hypothetical protein
MAVVYIESPKIKKISMPSALPFKTSLNATINDVIKTSGKINMLSRQTLPPN